MPRQKSRRKSKKRSKSRRRSTKKGQRRKTARRAYEGLKKKSKRKSKSKSRRKSKSKSRRKSKKRSKSKSARSLKQLKARASRSRQPSRADLGKCEYGVAPNNECLQDMGKLSGGVRSQYRYNKAPLEGKVLNVKKLGDGSQYVYANLNPRQSIVIPVNPEELEKYFGSSKGVASLKAKLAAEKRNLKNKYDELEKVRHKLENIKKEKEKKKEPVSPNCSMLLSMIQSNLKLAKDKMKELEGHCADLEKVYKGIKFQEDVTKRVVLKARDELKGLTKAKKDAALALGAAKRKKSHVKKLLEDVIQMAIKVNKMCQKPEDADALASKMTDAQKAADKGTTDASKESLKDVEKAAEAKKEKKVAEAKKDVKDKPDADILGLAGLKPEEANKKFEVDLKKVEDQMDLGFGMDDEEVSDEDMEFYY